MSILRFLCKTDETVKRVFICFVLVFLLRVRRPFRLGGIRRVQQHNADFPEDTNKSSGSVIPAVVVAL